MSKKVTGSRAASAAGAAAPATAPAPAKSLSLVQMYLLAYNAACMAGWAYVLFLASSTIVSARPASLAALAAVLKTVWGAVAEPLSFVQWAMCLEVVHAAVGFVPSPVFTTFLQVLSRIVVLVVAQSVRDAQVDWPAGLLVAAWSLVEVPRYAFYVNSLVAKSPVYPLFWLRYTLFVVLYPAGITGEWLTMRTAAPSLAPYALPELPLVGRLSFPSTAAIDALLYIYFLAGPFMVANMWFNRVAAFKKRFAKPPPPDVGVVFPPDGKVGPDGKPSRTTTITSQKVIAAAIRGCGGDEAAAAADAVLADKNWKFTYPKHYLALVRSGVTSKNAAVDSAQAGLDWCYDNFQFAQPGGAVVSFRDGTDPKKTAVRFGTGTVAGEAAALPFAVPYDGGWAPGLKLDVKEGKVLSGETLSAQLKAWVRGGYMEQDASDAVQWTSDFFGKASAARAALAKTHFVMIGAGSAMGPFKKLLELGAHVVALDVNFGGNPWRRLLDTAKKSAGRVTFPTIAHLSPESEGNIEALVRLAGCSVIDQPAEIARWLIDWQATLPKDDRVVIGNYTYLDGDKHVKLSIASDAIISALRAARPSTSLAFLCTPTDVHVTTPEAAAASSAALGAGLGSFGLEALARLLSFGKVLVPNALPASVGPGGKPVHIVDGLSTAQSFNYALAKRIQHWRAAVEFEKGATVSSQVAPSTATISVIHNVTFAWGYGGMPYFGYEIFKQDTTNAVMTAILIHDILNVATPKNPANRKAAGIATALELFRTQSVHGGLWRSPYKVDSIGEVSVIIYFGAKYFLTAVATGVIAAGSAWAYRSFGGV